MTARPLFVVGLARSGTNLLARMLDRHPSVVVALDPFMPIFRSMRNGIVAASADAALAERFSPTMPFQDYYFDVHGPAMLDLMLAGSADVPIARDDLVSLRRSVADRATLESPELACRLAKLDGADHTGLLRHGLDTIAATRPGAVWAGCKEVWIIDFVPLLARAFPDARFFVIERDPRAIVASLLKMAERDPSQAAHLPSYMRHWRKFASLTRRYAADPFLATRLRRVAYEAIVEDPEAEARRLCDDLDLDFPPAMLSLSEAGWRGNSSYDHGGRDVYAHTTERWREVLPDGVLQAVEFLCGPEMALSPYQPIGEPNPAKVYADLTSSHNAPASWRSDSGDPLTDFGGELVRQWLAKSDVAADDELIRRCFLFRDTLDAIRQAGA